MGVSLIICYHLSTVLGTVIYARCNKWVTAAPCWSTADHNIHNSVDIANLIETQEWRLVINNPANNENLTGRRPQPLTAIIRQTLCACVAGGRSPFSCDCLSVCARAALISLKLRSRDILRRGGLRVETVTLVSDIKISFVSRFAFFQDDRRKECSTFKAGM